MGVASKKDPQPRGASVPEPVEVALPKPAHFVASSLKDLRKLPEEIQDEVGFSLQKAQWGGTADNVKTLKGNLDKVQEVRVSHETNTFRAYYTVEFERAIYILHCHMKKSKRGGELPKEDEELILARFKRAAQDYEKRYGKN